jgi:uncharacterized membrane protein YagU involved in acid resistance
LLVVVEGSVVSTLGRDVGLEVAMGPRMMDEEDRVTPPYTNTHQSHVKTYGSGRWQTRYGRTIVGHDPWWWSIVWWQSVN